MEQNRFGEANRCSAGQENTRIFCMLKVHCRLQKSPTIPGYFPEPDAYSKPKYPHIQFL
jgi:hypothetical protein